MCLLNTRPATRKTCIGYKAMWLSRNGKTLRSEYYYTKQRYAIGRTFTARSPHENGEPRGFHALTHLRDAEQYTRGSGEYWYREDLRLVLVRVECLDCRKTGMQKLRHTDIVAPAVTCMRMKPLAILARYNPKTRKLIPYRAPKSTKTTPKRKAKRP